MLPWSVAVNELVFNSGGWDAVKLNELPSEVVAANDERNPS